MADPVDLQYELEKSILGAILEKEHAIHIATDLLEPDYFSYPKHRQIFAAMKHLYNQGIGCDVLTVGTELSGRNQLNEIGGKGYLVGLCLELTRTHNLENWCNQLIENSIKSTLYYDALQIAEETKIQDYGAIELCQKLEDKIYQIRSRKKFENVSALVPNIPNAIQNLKDIHDGKILPGIPTYYHDLDFLFTLRSTESIILAARPSVGKTAFMINLADNIASHDKPVLIFSLEQDKTAIENRFICMTANISYRDIERRARDIDFSRFEYAQEHYKNHKIFIDDSSMLDISDLRARAIRMKNKHNIGIIFTDYLQLLYSGSKPESRQVEVADISKRLKALAKELQIPVVTLCQLNRNPEKIKDARPTLADLRESGAIENDADLVLFVHRKRDDKTKLLQNETEIIVGKQRNGPTGIVNMMYRPETMKFEAVSYMPDTPWSSNES